MGTMMLDPVKSSAKSVGTRTECPREGVAQPQYAPLIPETLANRAQRRTTAERPRHLARQVHQRVAGYPDMLDVAGRDTGARETPPDGGGREPCLVLDASKPLFFRGCHDLAVD